MTAPPGNDNTRNFTPVYQIPHRVSARTVNGDSESEEDFWSDDSEPFGEGPSTNPTSDLGPREREPNSAGTAAPRPFSQENGRLLQSGRPRPHAEHRQAGAGRQHHPPGSTAAPAWPRNYEEGPRMDHAFSSVGDGWYPFASNHYRGEHVVPYYNYNSFASPSGVPPGSGPPMPTGHPGPPPMNTGPGMYPGYGPYGMPPPPADGYPNMHPNYHVNQHPSQHPNQHPSQHANPFRMPHPYQSYPPVDGAAPLPTYPQPRLNIRRPSMSQDHQSRPRQSPPSPYAEPLEPYPRRTRGRREATPREYEYQQSPSRPPPSHGRRPRHARPNATERFASDSEGPKLNKENLEKLDRAREYIRAADEAGTGPSEKPRGQGAKLEQINEPGIQTQKEETQKPPETKEVKDSGIVETRIKNIEDSLQQLVTAFQSTALRTTTPVGVPSTAAQDPFRMLKDLESRQLMQQVSSLLQTLSGGLGVGFAPPAVPIPPVGSYTPMINLQHLASLLKPQSTPPPGHQLNINPSELTALYVQQLQQRIEKLERDLDAPTASRTQPTSDQQQASAAAGDMKSLSPLEYLKFLNEGMHHLNATLGASQAQDHIRDAEEVASTTTTTDSGQRKRHRRRTTATREMLPGDGAPVTTESRPGIMKPTQHGRPASRASSSSKKARFEDDISEDEDDDDLAYTYKPSRSSQSPHRHREQPRGQASTTPPRNMNIKATRSGSGSGGGSSSYPPRHEELFYDSEEGTAESRGLRRKSMKYAMKGFDLSDSTWKPVVPDPPPADVS